ncbi:hypothetical protein FCU45_08340 [Sulfurimonas crateris]|uniref:Uncharacterized protein n=1 Tax=Sulfurimonas crateris TaxID=2574727 RepID=A0A4U2Z685_9BACT|nr:hypothetical protein [Sulfurimonas crateris]TKI68960.1 hypothetical protein FCU45_08340 [Sulfurimonas crateris]
MGLLSEGYIKIENDTQLAYYEHVLENLAAKEVSALFILNNIVAIIALLLSIGAMMTSFTQNENLHSWYVQAPIIVVLLVVLYYGVYAEYTHRKEKRELPKMIAIVQNAIECYKKNKGKQMKIQMQINCEFDLCEIKSNLENKKQFLNNEIVLDYVKKHLLEDSINSAEFIKTSTGEKGNKGFLNQQISEFEKKFSI